MSISKGLEVLFTAVLREGIPGRGEWEGKENVMVWGNSL